MGEPQPVISAPDLPTWEAFEAYVNARLGDLEHEIEMLKRQPATHRNAIIARMRNQVSLTRGALDQWTPKE